MIHWDRIKALAPWLAAVTSAAGGGYLAENLSTVAEAIGRCCRRTTREA